ncbi:MAG: fumarate hydratase C-terminal domain-containing protein [Cytophagales bacterium]|nr:fumarate hydratase C-terminal domain-containing protein [Armatimonadota bacterium]
MAQITLTTPIDDATIRSLHAGDEVLISGHLYTGRDAVHKYLAGGGALPGGVDLGGGIIYHCGPVVVEREVNGSRTFTVTAAGPTTSIREEPYQADLIAKYGIRAVIGKGGMGLKTLEACRTHGAVYLHAIGGAAQVYADCIQGVDDVYLEEFGSPEAIWSLRVVDFPAIVTMDAHGDSLHEVVQKDSLDRLKAALEV